MCPGIRAPLKEIGLVPGGYETISLAPKYYGIKEILYWFSAQKMIPHSLITQLVIHYFVILTTVCSCKALILN
jgi:hypothetical protein